jgi:hypothetical protein
MKLITLATTLLLLGSGSALAVDTTPGAVGKGDAPTPYPSSSGRPSAILDDSQCQSVWQAAMNETSDQGSGQSAAPNPAASSSDNGTAMQSGSNASAGNTAQESAASDDKSEVLSADQATPFIANFDLADADKSGSISESEFQAACKKGWVQAAAGSEKLNMDSDANDMPNKGQTSQ